MASYVQIVLLVIYVVSIKGHYIDPFRLHLTGLRNLNVAKRDEDKYYMPNLVNDIPVNGDIFSYKYKNIYDNFYRDGNGYNRPFDPYFGYRGPLNTPNFDNMPLNFGYPNIPNKNPSQFPAPPLINIMSDGAIPAEKNKNNYDITDAETNKDKKEKSKNIDEIPVKDTRKILAYINSEKGEELKDKSKPLTTEKQPNDIVPKTNEVKDAPSISADGKSNLTLNANKDYILVDSNGNNAYLLHEDIPNNVMLNTNQPSFSNVMYVPVAANKNTVQQPNNQYYQYPNGQPSVSTNILQPGNIPTNSVPLNNQPYGNNVVYGSFTPNTNNIQQPANQGYQVPYEQPMSTNIPLNGINPNGYYNTLSNPSQMNAPSNNYSPSYIYIYANGQLTQIPGILINSPQNVPLQNGYNSIPSTSVPNYNFQNGNSPASYQVPTINTPVSNNIKGTGIPPQNFQSNNNLGIYNAPNGYVQSNTVPNYNTAGANNNVGVQFPVSNDIKQNGIPPQNFQPNNVGSYNTPNGYVQSNMLPNYNSAGANNNLGTPSSVSNDIKQNSIPPQHFQPNNNLGLYNSPNGYVQSNILPHYNNAPNNNPGTHSASYPVNYNGNNNQHPSNTPHKEENVIVPSKNDVPATYDPSKTTQVVPEASAEGQKYIKAQPAIMFSDFKDKYNDKEDNKEKEDNDHEEASKIKKDDDHKEDNKKVEDNSPKEDSKKEKETDG